MDIRLSSDQQAKVIADFYSEDADLQKDAVAVFCEHELTIHDIAAMAMEYGGGEYA